MRDLLGMAEAAERDAAQDRVVKVRRVGLALFPVPPGNSTDPGATQLTRMFLRASAAASLIVYSMSAALTAP